MSLPKISCQCLTFGRTESLEEAIEFFLRQDYSGPRELVIVNDLPQQRLHFAHPLVRIFNRQRRFRTLGEKRNFAVEHCLGEVIVCWDDDDGFLPSHLTACAGYLEGYEYARPNHCWVWRGGGEIERAAGSFIAQHVFLKETFRRVGGYREMNSGQDMVLDTALRRACRCHWPKIAPSEATYLFRWGNHDYHLSGYGRDRAGNKSGYEYIAEHQEREIAAGRIETGDLYLMPHFRHDYLGMARRFAASLVLAERAAAKGGH